ncbi:MAG TPA: hypothetical protein VGT98_00520, partial [Candidatus Elarobacter sp.]|nr:hypothetical protein [Candidatus Elarobacter sp.]
LVADGAEAFAAAIKRLYSDPVAWNRLSAASRSKLAPLLPERAKERLESIIAEAVRRRRARRSELVRA